MALNPLPSRKGALLACVLAAFALMTMPQIASAGCWRGRPRPTRKAETLYFNHRAVERKSVESMPAAFTWCGGVRCMVCMQLW
jgi:hypothetical protein